MWLVVHVCSHLWVRTWLGCIYTHSHHTLLLHHTHRYHHVDVSIAVSTEKGLITPIVTSADTKVEEIRNQTPLTSYPPLAEGTENVSVL